MSSGDEIRNKYNCPFHIYQKRVQAQSLVQSLAQSLAQSGKIRCA
jgi:hypothetical protein